MSTRDACSTITRRYAGHHDDLYICVSLCIIWDTSPITSSSTLHVPHNIIIIYNCADNVYYAVTNDIIRLRTI